MTHTPLTLHTDALHTDTLHTDAGIDATDRELLRLLRARLPSGDQTAPAARPAVDWAEVAARATQLSVAALIFDALQRDECLADVPPELYQTLQNYSNAGTLHNLQIYRLLHTHQIDVCLLKGVFLAQMVYAHMGLRPMGDIDLLIRLDDLARVRSLLAEAGFILGTADTDYHDRYYRQDSSLSVEIHWSLEEPGSPFSIDNGALWQRAHPAQVLGLPVYLLSPEDTLLHQCIHASYHHLFQRFSLRGLCDIQQLIAHYGDRLDWAHFCARADAWQAQRSAYLTLLLAQALLHVPVPTTVFAALGPTHPDARLQQWAIQRVLGKVGEHELPWPSHVARWHLSTTWSAKLDAAVKICFPPQEQIAAQYQLPVNSPKIWLGYLQRWSRIDRLRALTGRSQAKPDAHSANAVSVLEGDIGRTALFDWLREKS
jgi:hypothetical protein